MVWVGPRRSNRSFNDDVITIHPVHRDLRQNSKVGPSDRCGFNFTVNVKASNKNRPTNEINFTHHLNIAIWCLESNRPDVTIAIEPE